MTCGMAHTGSTLVHLLMRFYEPTEGTILLDGRNMSELSSRSVRKCCGFVAQDTQLFACSIEENLTYGLGRQHTQEELVAACVKANAHEFIMKTEDPVLRLSMMRGIENNVFRVMFFSSLVTRLRAMDEQMLSTIFNSNVLGHLTVVLQV